MRDQQTPDACCGQCGRPLDGTQPSMAADLAGLSWVASQAHQCPGCGREHLDESVELTYLQAFSVVTWF